VHHRLPKNATVFSMEPAFGTECISGYEWTTQ
jgi:hypothetical protein